MQNKREQDGPARKVIYYTKIEDVIGGCTLNTTGYAEGDIIPGGSVVGRDPATGLYKVQKTAKIFEAASNSAVAYKVHKGHNLKVGEPLASAVGAKAIAITAIDKSDPAFDLVTVSETIGVAIGLGATVFISASASATTGSALFVAPFATTNNDVEVEDNGNHLVGAWIRASLFETLVPSVTSAMKTALPHHVWIP